jgi:hypothetical protein
VTNPLAAGQQAIELQTDTLLSHFLRTTKFNYCRVINFCSTSRVLTLRAASGERFICAYSIDLRIRAYKAFKAKELKEHFGKNDILLHLY